MFLWRHLPYKWLLALAVLVYIVSPLDFLPDIFPFLGQIDDFVILTFLISNLLQNLPKLFSSPKQEPEVVKTIDVDATTIP
ncbi:MAG: DUF1232 domain-containing protein [Cyanobacteria bacterium KgW148]|nr:DUF1232 domain-containing protein [Cyanobacteria bacterium KgW148]